MNPFSHFTYYRRHKRQTLLLLGLITLVTLGVYVMVGVLDSILDTASITANYLTRFSHVYPAIGHSLEPAVESQIRMHPEIERVIPENGIRISWPSLFGGESLNVLGVSEADLQVLMDVCDLRLKEGRLLKAHTNEIMLPEVIARVLELEIGDQIVRSINKDYYENVLAPLVLVGILESDSSADSKTGILLGFASYEYLANHEIYAPRPTRLLVIAREGGKAAVDEFLENTILSSYTEVETHALVSAFYDDVLQLFHLVFGVVDCLVVVVIALVVGAISKIALSQRLAELGLLYAIGHQKNRLIRLLTLETAVLAGVAWIAGLVLSSLLFVWLKANLYVPRGMELDLANLSPIWFTIPIPLVATAAAAFHILRVFAHFDAVDIIERGKLSAEGRVRRRALRRSSARPLSSGIFYRRHPRQGLMLLVIMALMILGISFPAFFISPIIDAQLPLNGYLRQLSVVSPEVGGVVDPAVTTRINLHPSVAGILPARRLNLRVRILATDAAFSFYAVSQNDLPVLMDLYGVHLQEGRLPYPGSNEVVLSEAVAVNRGLGVGDTFGRPVNELDTSIPTEMAVVGILAPSDLWLGFASYEFLEGHELYASHPVHLLVLPAEGRKAELDAWLEAGVASAQTNVRTYGTQFQEIQQAKRSILLVCAALESVIALVAAIAVGVLNYIFFTQRLEEFGILHATGRSRPWLLLRTVKEAASVVGLAWLMGAAICLLGLLLAQVSVYAAEGVRVDFSNPAPWLFTLPIPIAVVVASGGAIAWTLSKFDSVSIIERRKS
jgi:ABC-type lipoprotein release transport system permease subunit